ncbi:MAG TPA: FHA domain-containing protein [Thermoanaerobaculia bacterium]|nr:FHA domain-containing protein [Thermoanaerobaculia bacterium]
MSLRLCPAGRHPMDPGWEVCPYCASESASQGQATHRSIQGPEDRPRAVPTAASPQHNRTVFGGAGAPRRVVGVLVTYTWRPEGEVFPVREGRNLVGSAEECEIRVAADSQLSGHHACIVQRPGGFWIDDEKSMNGTYVDGELVKEKRRLPESAVIRTGETEWRFAALAPPPAT